MISSHFFVIFGPKIYFLTFWGKNGLFRIFRHFWPKPYVLDFLAKMNTFDFFAIFDQKSTFSPFWAKWSFLTFSSFLDQTSTFSIFWATMIFFEFFIIFGNPPFEKQNFDGCTFLTKLFQNWNFFLKTSSETQTSSETPLRIAPPPPPPPGGGPPSPRWA